MTWRCPVEKAVNFLPGLFNIVLESERMPEEWRKSVPVQSYNVVSGIKL